MEENKKEVKQDGEKNTHQKAFWIVGIALIIFLILVLGSVIGLKLTRDGVNNFVGQIGNGNQDEQNYVVLEDGTKENTSDGIKNAVFTIEGRKFYDFKVTEKNGLSTVEAKIQNVTEEVLQGASFKVRLFNTKNELIKEYTILTASIQPNVSTLTVTNVMEDCTDAASIEVEMVKADQVQKSGE